MIETSSEIPYINPAEIKPVLNPIYVADGAGLEKLRVGLSRIGEKSSPVLDMDYETNMADTFWTRKPRLLALGDIHEQFIIDFLPFAGSPAALAAMGNRAVPSWAAPVLEIIKPAIESKHIIKNGQNLAFEYEVSNWSLGLLPQNMYSIDIAERVLWAGMHSFKDLRFFSLASMTERYFKKKLDKTLQTQFDLEKEITEEDQVYSCLDLRLPSAIRSLQMKRLVEDNLYRVTKIENDAIGAFVDMHLNGMCVNTAAWSGLISEWTTKYREAIERLDTHFLSVVGKKSVGEIDLKGPFDAWKALSVESEEELRLKELRKAQPTKEQKDAVKERILVAEASRKAKRDAARKEWQRLTTRKRELESLTEKCVGEAAINYGSNKQLRDALLQMRGFNKTNLQDTDDDTLKKHSSKPVIGALRDFRTYEKLLQTYGNAWVKPWSVKPCNDEGWLSPYDGRVHSIIRQLEAETGRTSSVSPNTQNLPHDPRVRACFVAPPPREDIQISVCCDADVVMDTATGSAVCTQCNLGCVTKAEEQCIVTIDMSGAELRIIAEDSKAPSWVEAFQKKWDVHSVGAELLFPEEWPGLAAKPGDVDKSGNPLPECAYFHQDHKKCKCPGHLAKRDDNKAANFLIVYGGMEDALASQTDKTKEEAATLLAKHRVANPAVWDYLDRQGLLAIQNLEARDRSGRRRLFRKPKWEDAKQKARERMFEREKKKNGGKNPDGTKFTIDQCNPSEMQISSAMRGMFSSIQRQGKNMPIQGLNATIAKLAMGAGYDKAGNPFMWHLLRQYRAKLINFVHDEFVIECPKRHGQKVLELAGDCIRRAAAEFMTLIEMEWEGRAAPHWQK